VTREVLPMRLFLATSRRRPQALILDATESLGAQWKPARSLWSKTD
jgi:hypothetical protein